MNAIETVKNEVKEYNIVPFSAREISCDVNQNNPFVVIRNQYSALNRGMNKVMDAVGIRKNLTKDIFTILSVYIFGNQSTLLLLKHVQF